MIFPPNLNSSASYSTKLRNIHFRMLVCQQFKCTWAQSQPRTKQIQETNSRNQFCNPPMWTCLFQHMLQWWNATKPVPCKSRHTKIVIFDVGVLHCLNTSWNIEGMQTKLSAIHCRKKRHRVTKRKRNTPPVEIDCPIQISSPFASCPNQKWSYTMPSQYNPTRRWRASSSSTSSWSPRM